MKAVRLARSRKTADPAKEDPKCFTFPENLWILIDGLLNLRHRRPYLCLLGYNLGSYRQFAYGGESIERVRNVQSGGRDKWRESDWIFEVKLDGFRGIAVFDAAGKPHRWSRNCLPLEK